MKRIAFLTDIHLGEQFPIDNKVNSKQNFERVLKDLSEKGINEIIFGGDIGDKNSHNYFFDALNGYSLNLILGNHDDYQDVKKYFNHKNEMDALIYNTEDEYYKYLFLDSSKDEISTEQIKWMEIELKSKKKIILFIHHPIIEINTPVDKLYPLKNRNQLEKILVENGTDITVFCGHYHMNNEQNYKNIIQITTQSLCFQIVKDANELEIDNSTFGYRIITIKPENITTEFIEFKTEF